MSLAQLYEAFNAPSRPPPPPGLPHVAYKAVTRRAAASPDGGADDLEGNGDDDDGEDEVAVEDEIGREDDGADGEEDAPPRLPPLRLSLLPPKIGPPRGVKRLRPPASEVGESQEDESEPRKSKGKRKTTAQNALETDPAPKRSKYPTRYPKGTSGCLWCLMIGQRCVLKGYPSCENCRESKHVCRWHTWEKDILDQAAPEVGRRSYGVIMRKAQELQRLGLPLPASPATVTSETPRRSTRLADDEDEIGGDGPRTLKTPLEPEVPRRPSPPRVSTGSNASTRDLTVRIRRSVPTKLSTRLPSAPPINTINDPTTPGSSYLVRRLAPVGGEASVPLVQDTAAHAEGPPAPVPREAPVAVEAPTHAAPPVVVSGAPVASAPAAPAPPAVPSAPVHAEAPEPPLSVHPEFAYNLDGVFLSAGEVGTISGLRMEQGALENRIAVLRVASENARAREIEILDVATLPSAPAHADAPYNLSGVFIAAEKAGAISGLRQEQGVLANRIAELRAASEKARAREMDILNLARARSTRRA